MISQKLTINLLIATLLVCPFQCLEEAANGLQSSMSCELCTSYDDCNSQDHTPCDDNKSNPEQPDCICKGALVQDLSESSNIDFAFDSTPCFASENLAFDPAHIDLYFDGDFEFSSSHFLLNSSGRDICALISLRLI